MRYSHYLLSIFLLLPGCYDVATKNGSNNLIKSDDDCSILSKSTGSISAVHLSLLLSRTCVSSVEDDAFLGYWLDRTKDIDVCITSHIRYTGNISSSGRIYRCESKEEFPELTTLINSKLKRQTDSFERFKSIRNEFDFSETDWNSWFYLSHPLSPKFGKLLVQEPGEREFVIDFNALKPIEKFEILGLLGDIVHELKPVYSSGNIDRWELSQRDIKSRGFSIISLPNRTGVVPEFPADIDDKLSKKEKEKLIQDNLDYLREFERYLSESVNLVESVNSSTTAINFDYVCGVSGSRDNCIQEIKLALTTWVQDAFHVRSCTSSDCSLNIGNNRFGNKSQILAKYASQMCSCGNSRLDSLGVINGGNIFVQDSIAFIGKDDQIWLKKDQNHKRIGAQSNSENDIDKALSRLIFGNSHSHIIWVGSSDPFFRYSRSDVFRGNHYQPLFHIDLFFHPLGFNDKGEFLFVFSEPRSLFSRPRDGEAEAFEVLRTSIDSTKAKLERDLVSIGISPKAIYAPLYMRYGKDILLDRDFYFTSGSRYFANGHSDLTKEGQIRYYMPYYVEANSNRLMKSFTDTVVTNLQKEGVVIDSVPGSIAYNDGGALHCLVKVLRRE